MNTPIWLICQWHALIKLETLSKVAPDMQAICHIPTSSPHSYWRGVAGFQSRRPTDSAISPRSIPQEPLSTLRAVILCEKRYRFPNKHPLLQHQPITALLPASDRERNIKLTLKEVMDAMTKLEGRSMKAYLKSHSACSCWCPSEHLHTTSYEDELAELLSRSITLPNQSSHTTHQDWAESRPPESTGKADSSLHREWSSFQEFSAAFPSRGKAPSPHLNLLPLSPNQLCLLSSQSWIMQRQM